MPRVFLSYRRSDSQDVAGRIFDRLIRHLSADSVFKDVDSIPAGVDFTEYLEGALKDCSVVLVLIGPTYLTTTDGSGRRRLFDDPEDLVRREVETALALKIPIVPITVSNARMPTADDLPDSLKALASMNGLGIRPDPDFHRDIDRLLSEIAPFLGGHIRTELEQRRQHAARIRERLSTLAWQFHHMSELMIEGYPLIEGAAYIAQEIGRRLGTDMRPRILRKHLAQDKQLALSATIVGWWQARLPARLDELRGDLQATCAELTGQLEIFHELVDTVEAIWRDAYSPKIFSNILGLPGKMLLRGLPANLEANETVQALTSELHGEAALYFLARYPTALRLMDEFIRKAVQAFKALSDDDLVTATQGAAEQAATRTGTMRLLLDRAEPILLTQAFAELHRLIDGIEQALSKEQALAELKTVKGRKHR